MQIGEEKYLLSYRVTNRGGKGVKTINVTDKTGALIGLVGVEETDDLMITCESGVTIRMKVSAIREAGRATQGVKLINIDEGDKIAAIARIAEQEEEEAAGQGREPDADLKSRINEFKYIGSELQKIEAPDLKGKPATEVHYLASWRAHVWDFVASYDSVVNSGTCSGALRQLKPLMTEELLTYYDQIQDVRAIFAGDRDLEIQQLYGLCMRYQGDGLHPLPPPQLKASMARLMLVGDSSCYTLKAAGGKKNACP